MQRYPYVPLFLTATVHMINTRRALSSTSATCTFSTLPNLYLFHTPLGSNQNQSGIIDSNATTGLGSTVVNNWPICDGPSPGATVVARAQGLHIYAGNWQNTLSITFEIERFKGSTLQVMGISVEEGEWAIVGGTGQFAMANGVIHKKFHEQRSDGNIIELTIHGFCPVLKLEFVLGASEFVKEVSETFGIYDRDLHNIITSLKFITNVKTYGPFGQPKGTPFSIAVEKNNNIVGFFGHSGIYLDALGVYSLLTKLGPWGGNGGGDKDILEAVPRRMESITVSSGSIVDSIKFSYVDQTGQKHTAGPWGGSGGNQNTFMLGASEFVKEVSGTFGIYDKDRHNIITSLKFITNVKTYGPFGEAKGTPFTIPVQKNSSIVGFFGRSGIYLDALGVYVRPL
ncbi:32 kDa protein [Hordeum vulgare]|nr:32 kDa protein [Hordeum vulgare]